MSCQRVNEARRGPGMHAEGAIHSDLLPNVSFIFEISSKGVEVEVRWLRNAKRNNKMDTRTLRATLLEPCNNSALLLENVVRDVFF